MPAKRRVLNKCTTCGRIIKGNRCPPCEENQQLNDDVFEVSFLPSTPDNELPIKDLCPEDETCSCCFRISTIFYPLIFTTIPSNTLIRRHFTTALNSDRVTLCNICNDYLNPLSPQFKHTRHFKFAWPSVFWQLLKDQTTTTFWKFLPVEMRISWLNRTACNVETFFINIDLVTKPVFFDMSKRIESFNQFKRTWKLKDMIENVDREYFPCIKCPVGCEEFIDEYKTIDFVHYLGTIFPSFNQFNSQPNEFLRGMRPDYRQHDALFPDDPQSPAKHPSILVNDNGVFLLTCRDHGVKINKQYLHLPEHPAGRVFSPFADRFAPAVLNTRTMKPFRENYSTASYKMLKLNASFAGLNTCFLSENRVFDKVSKESVDHETFYLHTRKDTQLVLKQFVAKGLLSQKTAEELLNFRNDNWLQMVDNLKNFCNFVPLETVAFMRRINDIKEQPLPTVPEMDEVVTELDTEFVSNEDQLDNEFEEVDAEADPSSSIVTEETSVDNNINWNTFDYSCIKVMDRNLGAPPTTKLVGNNKEKIVIDMTANSVLFLSNVISCHLIRHKLSWSILNCFTKKKTANQHFKHALRLLERDLENASLYEMFDRLPFVNVISINSRDTPLGSWMVDSENDFHVFVASSGTSSSLAPQNEIEVNGLLFRLVYVVEDRENGKFFFRYKYCKGWWNICNPGRPVDTCETEISNLLRRNSWKVAIFEKVDSDLSIKEKNMSITNIFGQNLAYCNQHKLPLACDFPKNSYICQFDEHCIRKSAWRCTEENCESALCKSHMKDINEKLLVVPFRSKNQNSNPNNSNNVETVHNDYDTLDDDEDFDLDSYDPSNLVNVPVDSGIVENLEVEKSDAGAEAVQYNSYDDLRAIGSHVILNAVCSLLNRPSNPTHFKKKEWRFLQSFISKCPGESVPLTFPEAVLFPSLYYQAEEGSFCGAIPSLLFAPFNCNVFNNFADVLSHIRSRLKNFSLLTSSDPRLIQFFLIVF